jgi:hypothetical protein
MSLPIDAFWLMSNNVDRLRSDEEIRQVRVARVGMMEGDKVGELIDALKAQVGEVIHGTVIVAERDQKGFDELKNLAGAF